MSVDRPPAMRQRAGERVFGVNRFAADGEQPYRPLRFEFYPLRDALRADAALGEVCDALRDVWGSCRPEGI